MDEKVLIKLNIVGILLWGKKRNKCFNGSQRWVKEIRIK